MISELAYVHPNARIGKDVEIEPFACVGDNVVIGDGNVIMSHSCIMPGARIGNGNTIFPGAVIGAVPQDLKFRGEDTLAVVGDNNLIRENVTINRGTASKGKTVVGNNNLLMEGVHIAHDVVVKDHCIIGNSTKVAGEIVIDDHATISAAVLIHQFSRIGEHCMIQGGSKCTKDVPPYTIVGRDPVAYCGINLVGLKRRGFTNETIEEIHDAYRVIYQSGLNISDAIEKIKNEMEITPEIRYIIDFIQSTTRGIIK